MSESSKRKTMCANCGKDIILSDQLLTNGCPYCGSFKFKTARISSDEEERKQEVEFFMEKDLEGSNIKEGIEAIRLTKEGIFEIDIGKLLTEQTKEQPLILRNKDGSYRVKFQKKETYK